MDWSFAVLELLREQGWDVKEMNERYSFYFILAFEYSLYVTWNSVFFFLNKGG